MDDIAIVGMSFRFPGGLETEDSFWEALLNKENTATTFPKDRLSDSGVFHPQLDRRGTIPFRGGHFLTSDISRFDAPFFSISDTEARSLDPQQRILLETTYRALENGGFPLERVKGTNTSVYTGCFTNDWQQLTLKDAEQCTSHAGVGFEASILANRLSWFFDFKGASFNVDSACSSSLVCVDLACKALLSGEVDMSIAAGCNLIFYPDIMHALSNLSLLSPDNQSYSFDARANGYARGEGFGVLVLKRVCDAIRDNDCIRSVIRGSGSGQDGYTSGLTNPNGEAQSKLIKDTYDRAGLSMEETRFVEAHGTGTAMGDPIEANAIGRVFKHSRSEEAPLYVGALKSNIGHLEGASGIAGIIKAVLVLEKGVIPPNANIKKINPQIDSKSLRIKFPNSHVTWPTKGLRRASINSFGFGGTNSHVILDDALHYLKQHGRSGIHNTIEHPTIPHQITIGSNEPLPKLLIMSAKDEYTLLAHAELYTDYVQRVAMVSSSLESASFRDDFIYTLSTRRTQFPWRSFASVASMSDLTSLKSLSSPAIRVTPHPALCIVFTGQGAQYTGTELLKLDQFEAFSKSLTKAERFLQRLGCHWKVREELYRHKAISKISDPQYSQPITTILQVALVDLIRSFNCQPKTVIGHSSGEIAAAYCKGAISQESAWKISYFRGALSSTRANNRKDGEPGAMMAVGLSQESVITYIQRLQGQDGFNASALTIACINSPNNVTVSGSSECMDILEAILSEEGIFSRRLNIDIAYHSPYMNEVKKPYLECLVGLKKGNPPLHAVDMISTVTGKWVDNEALSTPQYWVDNMISPVLFAAAIAQLQVRSETHAWENRDSTHGHLDVTFLLEVGFHPVLKSAVMETMGEDASRIVYESTLVRNRSPLKTLFNTLGRLFCHGFPLDLRAINTSNTISSREYGKVLCNLPQYPFSHTERYWEEGRISKRLRLDDQGKLDLLGKPTPDWNDSEPMWRNFIRVSDMSWVKDHKINGLTLYPAAGMLVMALEAAKQTAFTDRSIQGYELRDVKFLSSLNIPTTTEGIETHFHLRHFRDPSATTTSWSEFRLFSYDMNEWQENCRGSIRVHYQDLGDALNAELESLEEISTIKNQLNALNSLNTASADQHQLYDSLRRSGFDFGQSFQLLRRFAFAGNNSGRADVDIFKWPEHMYPQPHIIHPCTLDAVLHLSVAVFAEGGAADVPTAIPSAVRKIWIGDHGLSGDDARSLKASTRLVDKDSRGAEFDIFVLDHYESKVSIQVHGLRSTVVAKTLSEPSFPLKVCYVLDLKPDISLLSVGDLSRFCMQARKREEEPVQFFEDLTFLLYVFLNRAMDEVGESDIPTSYPHLIKYYQWANIQLCRFESGELPNAKPEWRHLLSDKEYFERKCQEIGGANSLGRAYVETGRTLVAILRGNKDPLAFLFESDLLAGLYREVNSHRTCFDELSRLLDAFAHKDRALQILEVGAGTGGTTNKILSTLTVEGHGAFSGPRYAAYYYTDLSASFFESARNDFAQYSDLKYQALDINIDPEIQGFKCGTFDLIIAANTIHVTPDVNRTLANVRKLMKPGGLLVMYEPTRPELLRTAFIMGLLPGWWLGTEPDRIWGPTLTCARWDRLLRDNGFSGNDLELPDFVTAACQEGTIIVSKATSTKKGRVQNDITSSPAEKIVCVLDLDLTFHQVDLRHLEAMFPEACRFLTFRDACHLENLSETYLVFLEEMYQPCLLNLSSDDYPLFKKLFHSARGILWVTGGGGRNPTRPEYHIADGLFRVLRHENAEGRYATLALDLESGVSETSLRSICQVLGVLVNTSEALTTDMEYVEIDGLLNIPRVIPDMDLSKALFDRSLPQQNTTRKIKDCPPLQLAIKSVGFLDTLHFDEDKHHQSLLASNEIEVEVCAIGLNFRDCLLALGRVPGSQYGSECSGIVSRVGHGCSFSVGDRVAMSSSGTFKTHARGTESQAIEIPKSMSFIEAASIPTQFCTAWQAIHELARLREGESILIHSGAGGTGQAAIQLALLVGSIVYVTVGSLTKKEVLVKEYGIADDHIFNSRDLTFAKGVMRKTNGRGVDVILNSLAGDSLVSSWECIAPYGRFIELGKRDVLANANLPMYSFRKNTSFICFDGFTWQLERPAEARRTLENVFQAFADGVFRVARPLHLYSLAQTEQAFQTMQGGKVAGKIVLEVQQDTMVKARLATRPSFFIDGHSTYVVAGGLGGIGRSVAMSRTEPWRIIFGPDLTPAAEPHDHRLIKDLTPAAEPQDHRLIEDLTPAAEPHDHRLIEDLTPAAEPQDHRLIEHLTINSVYGESAAEPHDHRLIKHLTININKDDTSTGPHTRRRAS